MPYYSSLDFTFKKIKLNKKKWMSKKVMWMRLWKRV